MRVVARPAARAVALLALVGGACAAFSCATVPPPPALPPPLGAVGEQRPCVAPLCTIITSRKDAEKLGEHSLFKLDYESFYVLRIGVGGALYAATPTDAGDVIVVDVPTDLPCTGAPPGVFVRVPRDPRPLLLQTYTACGISPAPGPY